MGEFRRNILLTRKHWLRTVALLPIVLLPALPAQAGVDDILIGLDEKIVYEPDGPRNLPPGKDAVVIMDISDPAHPKIRASLPLMNSLLGPPTNLQITPDGRLGLVANSVVQNQDGAAWKPAPDDKLYVIDLTANPPRLIDTVTVGKQPSGLAISRKGDLALIANRAGKSVSVVAIQGNSVKSIGEVPMENEAAAVAITPDGRRAFVCLNLVNKVAVLAIDGQQVTYDKSLDIPAAFNPYNIETTPDGKYAIASNIGAQGINGDAEVVIDPPAASACGHRRRAPASSPSPNGKWMVSAAAQAPAPKPLLDEERGYCCR